MKKFRVKTAFLPVTVEAAGYKFEEGGVLVFYVLGPITSSEKRKPIRVKAFGPSYWHEVEEIEE